MREQFLTDVDVGLSQQQKNLSSKYFYDAKGDALFMEIMQMPEYYLTRAEMEIFAKQSQHMIDSLKVNKNEYFELIELGAGDGSKTKELLKVLLTQGYQFDYMPVDISSNVLAHLQEDLQAALPKLSIKPQHGDYFKILHALKESHHPKVLLFLGSSIGNLTDAQANEFIYDLGANLSRGDKLLMGVDLIKPVDIVLPAYNDAQGITRAFNLNLLHRINNELGGDFDVQQFSHSPEYTEEEGVAKSYLESIVDQSVTLSAMGKTYHFKQGEKIHMEVSRKYNDAIMKNILKNTDFTVVDVITDSQGYFADYILDRH